MHPATFSLQRYLARIGITSAPDMTAEGLATLMRAQLYTVPFENLDVQAGKIVSMVPDEIATKILDHSRGGYCYEVNGLFAMALEALDVPYYFVAARPMFYPVRRPKTHMALIVTIEGERYLFDLGFGGNGIRLPLRLSDVGVDIQQENETFRLLLSDDGIYTVQSRGNDGWEDQYGFDLTPQEWIDFVPANHLNSTHPDTIFVKKLLVVLQNPTGKTILLDDVLKIISDGKTETREIPAPDRAAVLADVFGLS